MNDVEEDGVQERIDIAAKTGKLDVQNSILNEDQARKIGISLQKLSSLNSDCRFLDVGMGVPNSERENPPKLDPIDPSGVKLSSGSGFFVNSEGKILTNEHVVASCDVIAVRYSDRFSRLSLISKNESLDLAILELNEERSTDFLSFADSIETGQDVYAFGYPLGDQLSEEIKVTNGIISSLAGIKNDQTRMQITNALQPGNSGGPLTDAFGLVVGVIHHSIIVLVCMNFDWFQFPF